MSIKALLNIQHKMECQAIEEMSTGEINGVINELYSKVESLQQQNDKLTADNAALVEALEAVKIEMFGFTHSKRNFIDTVIEPLLKQAKGM